MKQEIWFDFCFKDEKHLGRLDLPHFSAKAKTLKLAKKKYWSEIEVCKRVFIDGVLQ